MNDIWVIAKNTERYGSDDHPFAADWPDRIVCFGTKEQAEKVARYLTNYQAGCDYAFYVVGGEGDEP